ncbi:MAG: hypothetical protein AAF236_08790 [Verrucomicrobiota bacterium]
MKKEKAMPDVGKIALGVGAVGVLVLGVFGVNHLNLLATLGAGMKSLTVCNETFVAKRSLEDINSTEITYAPELFRKVVSVKIDREKKVVTGSIGPLGHRKSVYREGYGCTLITGELVDVPMLSPIAPKAWKTASPDKYGIDGNALNDALDTVFKKAVDTKSDDHRAMVFIKRARAYR